MSSTLYWEHVPCILCVKMCSMTLQKLLRWRQSSRMVSNTDLSTRLLIHILYTCMYVCMYVCTLVVGIVCKFIISNLLMVEADSIYYNNMGINLTFDLLVYLRTFQ